MEKYKEIALYGFFGVLTTVVNWITYIICNSMLGIEMTISNAIAWVLAVLFAFFTNKFLVFRSMDMSIYKFIREGALFFASRITTGIVEIFLPTLLYRIGFQYELLNIEGSGAKVLVSIIVVILNYFLSKKIIFIKKQEDVST